MQLLVSESDVENYKQIKCDLDELRLMVEKSELWVFKAKQDSVKKKKTEGEDGGKVRKVYLLNWIYLTTLTHQAPYLL